MKDPTARVAMVALVATTSIQVFTSLAVATPAVLAPALAPDLGITPQWIGVFIGLVYAGAMLGSLASGGFIAHYGSIRLSQFCMLLCSVGIGLVALLPASAVALLVAAAFLLGLGYGPITPASSAVLSRTTPAARMGLTFSIKQTGVPAGAAVAGAVMPALALLAGWRAALLWVTFTGLLAILAIQPVRRMLDTARTPRQTFSLAALVGPLRTVLATPELRTLALTGFALASVQVCLSSFIVLYLFDTLKWSLVAAGLALTCATVSAVFARILWGMVSDRWLGPRRVLALIGAIATVCGLALAAAQADWPAWVVLAVAVLYGGSAIGWNGVQLAEVARHSPPGSAGAVTGASAFITLGGVMAGPPAFAVLAAASGSYRAGFAAAALMSGLAAAALVLRRPKRGG